jgi:hypothetical protein
MVSPAGLFVLLSTIASLAAASPTPPPDLQFQGAGNVFMGGEGGPPAEVHIVGAVISNRGQKTREIRVTGLEILADGLPPARGLGAQKITAVDGLEVDAEFHPLEKKRSVDPLRLAPGDSVHVDITIDGFSTMRPAVARVSITVDGKKSVFDLPLDVQLRIPLKHDTP